MSPRRLVEECRGRGPSARSVSGLHPPRRLARSSNAAGDAGAAERAPRGGSELEAERRGLPGGASPPGGRRCGRASIGPARPGTSTPWGSLPRSALTSRRAPNPCSLPLPRDAHWALRAVSRCRPRCPCVGVPAASTCCGLSHPWLPQKRCDTRPAGLAAQGTRPTPHARVRVPTRPPSLPASPSPPFTSSSVFETQPPTPSQQSGEVGQPGGGLWGRKEPAVGAGG